MTDSRAGIVVCASPIGASPIGKVAGTGLMTAYQEAVAKARGTEASSVPAEVHRIWSAGGLRGAADRVRGGPRRPVPRGRPPSRLR